jgi:hypothetical protein
MKITLVPHTPPRAPEPEPEAILRFGDIEIKIGLTFLHHLRDCRGWGDTQSIYASGDKVMGDGMEMIEKAMWAAIDMTKTVR